ncbi:TPA: ferredoxin [Candidatus Woesearchaeota archaeon]|nr:ferredoxin [Candidatus Woesearchaeota archaeon]HIH47897.1 ferredoxin [Candidatus Woesearchaeota archaeon]HII88314.1 ferredoxin [Candidatus Woesearchaeota archaeon]
MTEKKKYKIWYERKGCIGAASCEAVFPEVWKVQEDNKATILDQNLSAPAKKSDDEESIILELSDEELKRHLEAAEVCPVNVIHVEEVKTKKKLI